MESRLLLSGNQLLSDNTAGSSELDYGIWNLDSLHDNYAIISASDDVAQTPDKTPSIASPRVAQSDVVWVAAPGVLLGVNESRAASYQQIRSALDQGVINTQQFTALYTDWRDGFSLNSIATSQFDLHLPIGVDRDGTLSVIDYVQSRGTLDGVSQSSSIPRLALSIDLSYSGEQLPVNNPLNSLGDLTVQSILEGVQHESLVDSPRSGSLVAAPIAEIAPLELFTTITAPNTASLTWQVVHIVPFKLATVAAEHDAVDKLGDIQPDDSLAVDAPSQPLSSIPAPARVAVLPVPTRRADSDETLAEAIDTLLSEDTILAGQTAEFGTKPAAEVAPATAEFAEGGMISIEQIVGATPSDAAGLAPAETQLATESTGLVGELSRVAVMELIEGEPEPAAPQPAGHVALLAAGGSDDGQPAAAHKTAKIAAERAGQAIAMAAPLSPIYLATFAAAASDAFAASVNSQLSAPLSDAARSEAFSEWADDDASQSGAVRPAPLSDHAASLWLGAAPLVVALACERALAAKKKRREHQPNRPSVKAK